MKKVLILSILLIVLVSGCIQTDRTMVAGEHSGGADSIERREYSDGTIEYICLDGSIVSDEKLCQFEDICSYNTLDCEHFGSQVEAQRIFEACGGTHNDVHKLDGDDDGIACESLP
jgi:hypothetical protein